MATSGAAVTVRVVVPDFAPNDAVMVDVPASTPVARPPLLMVALVVFEELQVAEPVRSCLLLSLKIPVALNCWVGSSSSMKKDWPHSTRRR